MYRYEAAFGTADMTGRAMRRAIDDWFRLYYSSSPDKNTDPCQRLAYTVVEKLVKAVFGEYTLTAEGGAGKQLARALEQVKEKAMQLALVGGECYLKPCPEGSGFSFTPVSRKNMLVFGRAPDGEPTDVGLAERSCRGGFCYTLLERRYLDSRGRLVIENRLYRSRSPEQLGQQVRLTALDRYAQLEERAVFPEKVGLGLVRLCTPMLNCVDGSNEGVSVYAAAAELIRAVDENEAQLRGEFQRGQSRVFLSSDLLRNGKLEDHLFVGLDEDPERVGVQIFSPTLRHESYLARKQEYLRNIETVVGLKRGMLSDANVEDRTATEIAASAGEFSLTVLQLQAMWAGAVEGCFRLCQVLGGLYGLPVAEGFAIDWGNGVLYDEDKLWQSYLQMVDKGLLKPEIALGWRFGLPAETAGEQATVRAKLMPPAED